jgi:hypothetical protein
LLINSGLAGFGITRSLASFVAKPFGTFLKKALKEEVETGIRGLHGYSILVKPFVCAPVVNGNF